MPIPRYETSSKTEEGYEVVVLRDARRDARAEIVPANGNNLIRFEAGGRPAILAPPDLRSFRDDPQASFRYGTPILYPPNRVKNGELPFRGRTYRLPLNEPRNHLHGEISSRRWEVTAYGASEDEGAYVTSRFRYEDHPDMTAYFPHELDFAVTYRLLDGALHMETAIRNESETEAPFAFGLHPYFPIFPEDGEEIRLQVPAAAKEWPVTDEAFVTGTPGETEFSRSLRRGIDLREYPVSGCTMIELAEEEAACRIELKKRGYAIAYRTDRQFPFLLLFRPPWAGAFSLEPYTSVTDAFNLPYAWEMTGARGIGPKEQIRLTTSLWIEN
ncbi:aldose 1-epimerase [Cohnella zeiphila]|uniref:Aldose 1-epimerase n=1 Tax=Cohnella zeiphila TaxID=2761120 RepID=A0A7X0SR84_9BACL|nr:aldose 1-epimerase [Cohnella zeiphila]MBB6733634.1 aldose 1-epimerase [Cohnella zeiphila]